MTFIAGYQRRRFLRVSFSSSWGYLYFLLLYILLQSGGRGKVLSEEHRTWYSCYSHHLPKEKCFLGWRGEGGVDDLYLGGLRVGGRNHWPGVSGHWCDSGPRGSSSSSSGGPLEISRITGGKSSLGMQELELSASCRSSRRMREVRSAAGGSSLTSMTESGWAERGGVCG